MFKEDLHNIHLIDVVLFSHGQVLLVYLESSTSGFYRYNFCRRLLRVYIITNSCYLNPFTVLFNTVRISFCQIHGVSILHYTLRMKIRFHSITNVYTHILRQRYIVPFISIKKNSKVWNFQYKYILSIIIFVNLL